MIQRLFLYVCVFFFFCFFFVCFFRSRSSKGSCQVSSSSDQSNAAELEEGNGDIKITSFVGTQDEEYKSTSVSNESKESKLTYRPEISLNSSRESDNTTVSIQPASIDHTNQKETSCLNHKITLDVLQPSPSKKETDFKTLVQARK